MIRWVFIVLLMCNGIYFLWQNYLVHREAPEKEAYQSSVTGADTRLELLAERIPEAIESGVAKNVERVAEVKVDHNIGSVEAKPAAICWQIGPFKEEVSGKQVVSRLAAMDIDLQLNRVEVADKPDYWVHIPPQVSRREAIKLLRQLQAKKIDSFLITEGELANGISLGFFTQKDRAESIHSQRQKQGYQAQIKIIPRTHIEMWAIFDEGAYGELTDLLWDKITEGNQGLERRKNYCDKIASANNID